jgi:hypothetical protein
MQTTRVIFNIPIAVKSSAVKRAKREGLTLTTLLTQATRAYGAGELDMQAVDTRPLRPSVIRAIKKAAADAERGINVSGPFTLAESQKHLRSLMR